MSMQTRWVGKESVEAIADVRMKAFWAKPDEREKFLAMTKRDRFGDGDVLLAEHNGAVIGSATAVPLQIGVRGGVVPCQGVAWVGTVRSHRRRRVDGHGIASTVVRAILDKARQRGDVVSALMPFRTSFYEHFGYGAVERQNIWTLPLDILPTSEATSYREFVPGDEAGMAACRSRQVVAGQCDVDGGMDGIRYWLREWQSIGFTQVDQPTAGGPITGFVTVQDLIEGERAIAQVEEPAYDSHEALLRSLGYLANLKDQFSFARIHLPVDVQLNWILKERQMAHRRVDHNAATCRTINRMQLRVLDHKKFIEAMKLAAGMEGKTVVAVLESEGHESRFTIDFTGDQASVSPSQASSTVVMKDHVWAAIVTGALSATEAKKLGLIQIESENCTPLLDRFAAGPAAFCWEYF